MYLERYLRGEYEQVWKELDALGSAVYQEVYYQDAWAVAQETMRRVRHNIETLILKLIKFGFVFGYDHRLSRILNIPPDSGEPREPIIVENTYLYALSDARAAPPLFLAADLAERNRRELSLPSDQSQGANEHEDSLIPDMPKYLNQLEEAVGVIPLSLKAWYKYVGAVNFYGFHPGWAQWYCDQISHNQESYYFLMSFCDPLTVDPLTKGWRKHFYTIHMEKYPEYLYGWEFAPDKATKDITSGAATPYLFLLPDAHADASIIRMEYIKKDRFVTFLEYMRLSLSWAGFPGMSQWPVAPKEDIAFLTQGLLPF